MSHVPYHSTRIKIYYFDTDAGGVVHNVAYLRMIEVARTELAEALGWTVAEMHATNRVPVVARTEIDYLKPAHLGDVLRIEGHLTKLEKIRFHLSFDLVRESDGAKIAFCRQTMVTVQLPGGRPQPVPPLWVGAFPHLVGDRD
jgi:YbgC/YbaW family acyl-CoA thioester hydrolase